MLRVFLSAPRESLFIRCCARGLLKAVTGGVNRPGPPAPQVKTHAGQDVQPHLFGEDPRESILNSFVFNSDSPSKTLGQQLVFEYYDYPLDWLDRYQQAIRETTVEDVRLAAKKHIDTDKLAIMVVGPSEGHDRPLTDFGPVSEIDISIAPPPGQ